MLSKTEREFLQGECRLTGKSLGALQTRIRKKAELGINDLAVVCKNLEKINPKTENNSWKTIETFCKSQSSSP